MPSDALPDAPANPCCQYSTGIIRLSFSIAFAPSAGVVTVAGRDPFPLPRLASMFAGRRRLPPSYRT
ncbi:hypothetical protein C2L65_06095 [Paraburkholderia terrae]|uniref:Uncharacterized protein n=1 Tax=Paraburkholderia terrae TaxID=311230 RepID=A0A2I8EI91_9BURK|nr:hypothetical protein C2L65_06095 [Paraburkholderia terrae]